MTELSKFDLYLARKEMEKKTGQQPAVIYAGFGVRFKAVVLDALIVTIPIVLIWIAIFQIWNWKIADIDKWHDLNGPYRYFWSVPLFVLYFTAFSFAYGATPGKMILNLKVVGPDLKKPGLARSFSRAFVSYLYNVTVFFAGLPFLVASALMVSKRNDKRALHDFAAGTRVIYASPPATPGEPWKGWRILSWVLILSGIGLNRLFFYQGLAGWPMEAARLLILLGVLVKAFYLKTVRVLLIALIILLGVAWCYWSFKQGR